MENIERVKKLARDFAKCQSILTALGDENRQHIVLEMMTMGNCRGVRVGEITKRTNLSRPAVSHHLQILKAAGILKVRKEATMNYYYFDPDMESFERMIHVLEESKAITSLLPDRSEDTASSVKSV